MPVKHSLEKALPFLLARTGISMGQAFTKELLPFSISLIEWRVCVTIYETQDSTLSQVAQTCSNDPSTISRTFVLHLTAKGRQVTQKIIPLAQAYEAQALIDFSTQETDQLRRLLKRVHVNMGKNSTAL